MKRLCTICVRGGSKGVPGKNWKDLLGTPLFLYSVKQALDSRLFDKICVSTDSEKVVSILNEFDGEVELIVRPGNLALDSSPKIPVIQHALQFMEDKFGCEFDVIVDLDVTSPLRLEADIIKAVKLLEEGSISNVLTVSEAHRSPYFNQLEIDREGKIFLPKKLDSTVLRRQDSPAVYDLNASIYPWRRKALLSAETVFLKDTKILVMPQDRSYDIDSEIDFFIVESLLKRRISNDQ